MTATQEQKTWIDYWDKDEFWAESELWKLNSRIFFERVQSFLTFQKTDSVLNIGCGPGYLERRLSPVVGNILAVDTSERFVNQCQRNCADLKNVEAVQLRENYTDLNSLGRPFSLFLAVSVVQYYRNIQEIEALIRSAQSIARPGARMLIADFPRRKNFAGRVLDALMSLGTGLKEGYLPVLWRTWLQSRQARTYQKMCGEVKNLTFTLADIQNLVQRMSLRATVISTSLSVISNRPSLLIEF